MSPSPVEPQERLIARNIATGLGKMILFHDAGEMMDHYAEGVALLEEGIKDFMLWLKEEL